MVLGGTLAVLGGVAVALDRTDPPLALVLVGVAAVFAAILILPIVTHQARRLVPTDRFLDGVA